MINNSESNESKFFLQLWKEQNIHEKWKSRTAKPFILHDGPPYANGNAHMGHAANKILKDCINKFQAMSGYKINYIQGWDCHGMPIENRAEREFEAEGLKIHQVDCTTFLDKCKSIANRYICSQADTFENMGIISNNVHYTTMQHHNEISVIKVIHDFARRDLIYMAFKPVMWSCEEGTSLAAAEVEYYNKKSTAIYAGFRIISTDNKILEDAMIVIWTTTPWTIPMNQAIAYDSRLEYVVLDSSIGRMVIASELYNNFVRETKNHITDVKIVDTISGDNFKNVMCQHPLYHQHIERNVPLYASDHVVSDIGTGFVHIAPDHGEDDFKLGKKHGLECLRYINDDGLFAEHAPPFLKGRFFADVEADIIKYLTDIDHLVGINTIVQSYPHSWRSKKPLIYRATKQLFVKLKDDKINLIKRCNQFADQIQWMPARSKQRFTSILQAREEWCISRQRRWGVPIALFYEPTTGELILNENILTRTIEYLDEHGIAKWWEKDTKQYILGELAEKYEQILDIVDVWAESGATWLFLPDDLAKYNIDMLIEGSDQHRAWFQTSNIIAAMYSDTPKFNAIKTHGYVTDTKGHKMSKSLGNGIEPQEIIDKIGPDCLRLWVLRQDTAQDITYSKNQDIDLVSMKNKIHNTMKFMINHASDTYDLEYNNLDVLEKWLLHRVYNLHTIMLNMQNEWNIHVFVDKIHDFCEHDLSKIYIHTRKNILYGCSDEHNYKSKIQQCIGLVFRILAQFTAPILSFTAENAWYSYHQKFQSDREYESIFLTTFNEVKQEWHNDSIELSMKYILMLRKSINGVSEHLRAAKKIKDNRDLLITFGYTTDTEAEIINTIDHKMLTSVVYAGQIQIIKAVNENYDTVCNLGNGNSIKIKCSIIEKHSDR